MSILDTFYVLFKGDTTDLKKKTDEAKKSTDDLNTNLTKTQDIGEGIKDIFFDVARFFTTIAAGAFSLTTVVGQLKHAQQYTKDLSQASAEITLPAADLDAWAYAFKTVGGDLSSLKSNLKGFQDATGALPSVAIRILPQVADTLQKLNQVQAFKYGRSLGLDDNFITLLRQWGASLPALIDYQKQLGVVTQNDVIQSRHFTNATNDLSHALNYLFVKINTNTFPFLTKNIREATATILDLQDKVDPFFEKIKKNMSDNQKLSDSFGKSGIFGILNDEKSLNASKESLMKTFSEIWNFFSISAEKSMGFVISLIDKLSYAFDILFNRFSFNGDPIIKVAQDHLNIASNSPIASQTSNSIFSSKDSNQNSTTTIGEINITAPDNTATGITDELKKFFNINNAIPHFQNGVAK